MLLPRLPSNKSLRISFSTQLSSFRVTQDDPWHVQVCQHLRTDFASESSSLAFPTVLGSYRYDLDKELLHCLAYSIFSSPHQRFHCISSCHQRKTSANTSWNLRKPHWRSGMVKSVTGRYRRSMSPPESIDQASRSRRWGKHWCSKMPALKEVNRFNLTAILKPPESAEL